MVQVLKHNYGKGSVSLRDIRTVVQSVVLSKKHPVKNSVSRKNAVKKQSVMEK